MAEPKPVKYYKMTDQLAQAVLSYLARQPYAEVNMMIQGLQQMPEVQAGGDGINLGAMSPEEIKKFFEEKDTEKPNPGPADE